MCGILGSSGALNCARFWMRTVLDTQCTMDVDRFWRTVLDTQCTMDADRDASRRDGYRHPGTVLDTQCTVGQGESEKSRF